MMRIDQDRCKRNPLCHVLARKLFYNIVKTNRIEYKPKFRKEAKRKQDEKVCTLERVDIVKGTNYYKPCYRARMGDIDTAKERKNM